MFNYCSELSVHHIARQCIVFSRNRISKNVPEWKTEYWTSFCAWTSTYKLQFLSPMLLATNPHICFSLMEAKNQNKQSSKWTPRVGINESYFLARMVFLCATKNLEITVYTENLKSILSEEGNSFMSYVSITLHTRHKHSSDLKFKKSWSISLSRKSILSISPNKKVTNASKESLLYSCNWDRAHFTKQTAKDKYL